MPRKEGCLRGREKFDGPEEDEEIIGLIPEMHGRFCSRALAAANTENASFGDVGTGHPRQKR